MTFLVSNIKEITKDKIIFYDNDYILQEIDLHECSKNWVEHFNVSDDYITWEGEPVSRTNSKENKCVGQRNWFAEKPYFEFFSSPKIRFELHLKRSFLDYFTKSWRSRYHHKFKTISLALDEAGWTTFDLG